MKQDILICECSNIEHQIAFNYNADEKMVYLVTRLCPLSFWKRLKNGIKYIFGHKSRFGEFDEFILRADDANKIRNVYKFLKK